MAPPGGVQTPPSPPRKIKKAIYENHNPTIISYYFCSIDGVLALFRIVIVVMPAPVHIMPI